MSATSQGEAHARSPDRSRRNRNRARGGLQGLREQIVPAISQLSGFQSGTWLTGNESSSALSLTVWDTEANAQVMAERFGIGSSPQMSVMISRCEVREVAATA
jgi:hypothetical protein